MAKETITVSAKVELEEKEALLKIAQKNEWPLSQVVRKAIKEYLANHKD